MERHAGNGNGSLHSLFGRKRIVAHPPKAVPIRPKVTLIDSHVSSNDSSHTRPGRDETGRERILHTTSNFYRYIITHIKHKNPMYHGNVQLKVLPHATIAQRALGTRLRFHLPGIDSSHGPQNLQAPHPSQQAIQFYHLTPPGTNRPYTSRSLAAR